MSRLVAILGTAGLFIYPLAVYFGIHYFEPRLLAGVLFILVLLRFGPGWFFSFFTSVTAWPSASSDPLTHSRFAKIQVVLAVIFLLAAILYSVGSNQMAGLKFYPLIVSVYLLTSFGYSLVQPPTVVERLARLTDPELSAAGVRYTRNITVIWCGFFIFNSLVVLYSIYFASFDFWALYNGFISYLLIGGLLGGEYLYRVLVLKADHKQN